MKYHKSDFHPNMSGLMLELCKKGILLRCLD